MLRSFGIVQFRDDGGRMDVWDLARKDFGISGFLTDGRYSRVWPEPLDHIDPCLA